METKLILFIGPYNILSSPNKTTGGIESHSRTTIQNLTSLNKRTLVVCWEAGLTKLEIIKKGRVIFIVLPKQKSIFGFLRFLINLRSTVYYLAKNKKIELIFIQSISYVLLSQPRAVRDKAMVFVHGIMYREYWPKISGSILVSFYLTSKWVTISALEFLSYCFYKRVVLINDEMRKFFPKKTNFLIRNTVNEDFIASVNQSEPKDKIFLCVGSVIQRKQQLKLINLFAESNLVESGWRLQLVGNCVGDYGAAVKTLSEKIAGVEIYQNVDNKMLSKFYQKASVFCLISLAESSPISIQEAMYARCKIIATDVGGVSELSIFSSKKDFALCSTDEHVSQAMYQFHLDFIKGCENVTHDIQGMREASLKQLANLLTETSNASKTRV